MVRSVFAALFLLFNYCSKAQVRVFKEVSEEVSSEMKVIMQNKSLVGYLVFTKLERVTEDSFNYQISILDENLNDIGAINFREETLYIESVSFEQDVLCLAYLKSNTIGKEFNNNIEYAAYNQRNSVLLQFLSLEGKISKTHINPIKLKPSDKYESSKYKNKFIYSGSLIGGVQLKNVPGKGFACFFNDEDTRKLILYNISGEILWNIKIGIAASYTLLTSKTDIYLMRAFLDTHTIRYSVSNFSISDGNRNFEVLIENGIFPAKVLGWGIDPVSEIPYNSGAIGFTLSDSEDGFYVYDFIGSSKEEVKKTFMNWSTIKTPYIKMKSSFRDFNGNTCFLGKRKGTKFLSLLTMDTSKNISYELLEGIDKDRDFYIVENPEAKEQYIITDDDAKNILIYNLKSKKIVRTMSKKDGKSRITIYPAKEGYIMVVENNKKEKYTKLSIESLN